MINRFLLLLCLLVSLRGPEVWAWGGRGHDTICEVAVHLLPEGELKTALRSRSHVMGHLCNIPDVYWKSLDPDTRKIGDPTHYIDGDVLGIPLKDVPIDFKKILADYTGKPNKVEEGATLDSVASELGSNWWRVDQLRRRIAARKEAMLKATPPVGSKQQQDDTLEYNKLIYDSLVDMGLMGHFVGDNSQPFHVTGDYDGYQVGHGGIHGYYEDAVVGQYDGNLSHDVLIEARKMARSKEAGKFLNPKDTVEKMKALALLTFADLDLVFKLDPILKKSEITEEKGVKVRTPALRKDPQKAELFCVLWP